jgi:hypothetical protein
MLRRTVPQLTSGDRVQADRSGGSPNASREAELFACVMTGIEF